MFHRQAVSPWRLKGRTLRSSGATVLAEYTFQELAAMANDLERTLYPTLILSIHIEQRTMLLVIVCHTLEYKHLLLAIDNT